MPLVPLPFVVALVLALLLARMLRSAQRSWPSGFSVLIGLCVLQGVVSGLHWNYRLDAARLLQPILASMLPSTAWLAFAGLRSEAPLPARDLLPHTLPFAVVLVLSMLWRGPLDLVLAATFLGYGAALLRLGGADPAALTGSRLADGEIPRRALFVVGGLLVASGVIDMLVALDLSLGEGRHAPVIVGLAQLATLVLASLVATAAERSRPETAPSVAAPDDGASFATVDPMSDEPSSEDTVILTEVDAQLVGRRLYRDPDLTLERLARRTGISARRISAAVNRIHGQNVSQFVNAVRIEEAKTRLRETNEPVTTVMLDVGFGTKSNFNREFRRLTGMSPSVWRRADSPNVVDPGVIAQASPAPGN